jgi:hypothetical protein
VRSPVLPLLPVRDGPVRDGPVRDGSVRDGSVRDGSVRDGSVSVLEDQIHIGRMEKTAFRQLVRKHGVAP